MKEMKTIDFGNDNQYEIVDQASRDDIKGIRDILNTAGSGNSKILWSGLKYSYDSVSFYVPQKFFHRNSSALTLVFEFSAERTAGSTNSPERYQDNTILLSICKDPSAYAISNPSLYGSYSAYVNTTEAISDAGYGNYIGIVLVRLNTVNYAECQVSLNSMPPRTCLTCIYAIAPDEP